MSCTTHHRSTHYDLLRLLLVSTAKCNYISDACSDWNEYVLRLSNSISINGDSSLNERHTCSEVLSQNSDCRNIT